MKVSEGYDPKVKFSVSFSPDMYQRIVKECLARRMHRSVFLERAAAQALGGGKTTEESVALKLLESYLVFERVMIRLDRVGDPRADVLRDLMDPLWYSLTEEDRGFLNNRSPADLDLDGSRERSNVKVTARLRTRIERAVQTYAEELVDIVLRPAPLPKRPTRRVGGR